MTVAIIIAAIVAVAVAVYFLTLSSRNGPAAPSDFAKRPAVADFHVRDDTALVLFDVTVAGEPDEHFASVLTAQALEVVREKQHHLPIAQVTKVVAQGKRNGESVEVGRVKLETPGELPPPLAVESPHARAVANDPLAAYSEALSGPAPTTVGAKRVSELGPAGSDVSLPTSVVLSLSERGFDVPSMTAGDLAIELLEMAGYTITSGAKPDCYLAVRAGSRTYLCSVGLGDYPEIESRHINAFVVDFLASKADRGLLISDRYGPFEVYDREKREPRVRFVTRERLQSFVDALTIS